MPFQYRKLSYFVTQCLGVGLLMNFALGCTTQQLLLEPTIPASRPSTQADQSCQNWPVNRADWLSELSASVALRASLVEIMGEAVTNLNLADRLIVDDRKQGRPDREALAERETLRVIIKRLDVSLVTIGSVSGRIQRFIELNDADCNN